VGHFKDESDVYAFIGRLLQGLADDPELAPQVRQANTTVQFRTHDPEAQITIDLAPEREMCVDLGPTNLEPEVVMSSDADTAHNFWLGRVDVIGALSRGQITARGPVAKVLRLVPLIEPAFERYEQMLRDAGRFDLIEAA
jgi:SCP-2 sterol transfer family